MRETFKEKRLKMKTSMELLDVVAPQFQPFDCMYGEVGGGEGKAEEE